MLASVLSIASYVLLALGLYTMAKRRGINKPWLAWIPVANVWLLGCISDQYRQVAKGEKKAKRKLLLTLDIVMIVLAVVLVAVVVSWFVGLVAEIPWPDMTLEDDYWRSSYSVDMGDAELEEFIEDLFDALDSSEAEEYLINSLGTLLLIMGLSLVLLVVSIWASVLIFMAYYDVFTSSDPKNATIFFALGLILSLFGLGVVMSVLVFVCREKDEGMPPRGQIPAVEA